MILLLNCWRKNARLTLPNTPDCVAQTLSALRRGFDAADPVRIIAVAGDAGFLRKYLFSADLDDAANLQTLNRLAERVDEMDTQELQLFSGVLDAESINGLNDVLEAALTLNQYEFIRGVASEKELGGWLVEHRLTGVDFPDAVRPYLDYAGIGAEYYANHGGAFTAHGYVKRREGSQLQVGENKSRIALELVSGTVSCWLSLPASENELEQTKQALGTDELEDGMICSVSNGYLWSNLLPIDGITLAGANALAEYLCSASKTELDTLGAALEAEEPETFAEAMEIVSDLDRYELVDGDAQAYGREALRMIGADDELLDTLDGFTDFERLGQMMMEEDGVQSTSFGLVRRTDSSLPEHDFGPMMG